MSQKILYQGISKSDTCPACGQDAVMYLMKQGRNQWWRCTCNCHPNLNGAHAEATA